jgi:hypothetical protein
MVTKNQERHSRNQRNRRANVAGVRLERQRRSLLQPEVATTSLPRVIKQKTGHNPNGVAWFASTPRAIGNPVGVVHPKIKYSRQATLSPVSGFNRQRLRRFDSRDSRNCRNSHKKASLQTDVSRAFISAANRFPAKYDFADRETAALTGALFITESTQRPFVRPLAKPRGVFFVAIGLLIWASRGIGKLYTKKINS